MGLHILLGLLGFLYSLGSRVPCWATARDILVFLLAERLVPVGASRTATCGPRFLLELW